MGAPSNGMETADSGPVARKTPITILIIGAIFFALGILDLYRAIAPLASGAPVELAVRDSLLVGCIGVAALAGGGFLVAGHNWARWLLAAWMMLHVVISVGEPVKLAAHVVIFGIIAFLLFRPGAGAYFRARTTPALRRRA